MATPSRSALVVIDAQQEYFAPLGKVVLPEGPAAVQRIARALEWARGAGVPVVHIVHESRRPDPKTFVWTTESIENIPPGWRARETIQILGEDEFAQKFELAKPGQEFEVYAEGRLRRRK